MRKLGFITRGKAGGRVGGISTIEMSSKCKRCRIFGIFADILKKNLFFFEIEETGWSLFGTLMSNNYSF